MPQTQIDEVLSRAWAEYREMPGLALNAAQARRLGNLDEHQCQVVLDRLVELQWFRPTSRGTDVVGTRPSASGVLSADEEQRVPPVGL